MRSFRGLDSRALEADLITEQQTMRSSSPSGQSSSAKSPDSQDGLSDDNDDRTYIVGEGSDSFVGRAATPENDAVDDLGTRFAQIIFDVIPSIEKGENGPNIIQGQQDRSQELDPDNEPRYSSESDSDQEDSGSREALQDRPNRTHQSHSPSRPEDSKADPATTSESTGGKETSTNPNQTSNIAMAPPSGFLGKKSQVLHGSSALHPSKHTTEDDKLQGAKMTDSPFGLDGDFVSSISERVKTRVPRATLFGTATRACQTTQEQPVVPPTPFQRPARRRPRADEIPYCTCGRPDDGSTMVRCSKVNDCGIKWYHLACTNLDHVPEPKERWYCHNCQLNMALDEIGPLIGTPLGPTMIDVVDASLDRFYNTGVVASRQLQRLYAKLADLVDDPFHKQWFASLANPRADRAAGAGHGANDAAGRNVGGNAPGRAVPNVLAPAGANNLGHSGGNVFGQSGSSAGSDSSDKVSLHARGNIAGLQSSSPSPHAGGNAFGHSHANVGAHALGNVGGRAPLGDVGDFPAGQTRRVAEDARARADLPRDLAEANRAWPMSNLPSHPDVSAPRYAGPHPGDSRGNVFGPAKANSDLRAVSSVGRQLIGNTDGNAADDPRPSNVRSDIRHAAASLGLEPDQQGTACVGTANTAGPAALAAAANAGLEQQSRDDSLDDSCSDDEYDSSSSDDEDNAN
ncbi:MAG: hypothetical protein M1819_006224 [Sarea resinae]|nr:MAG: hypothetical protein M1819_006224 [Sarea resinae]